MHQKSCNLNGSTQEQAYTKYDSNFRVFHFIRLLLFPIELSKLYLFIVEMRKYVQKIFLIHLSLNLNIAITDSTIKIMEGILIDVNHVLLKINFKARHNTIDVIKTPCI